MATWDSWLQKAKDEANNWAGKAWGVGEDVASGLEDTWHNWWNPADNPRNKTMTPEQIAWENPGVFTRPENNAVPVKQFLEQAVAGAEKPTDPNVHMLSSLRDAPVVGGAIRTGELAMNGLQALQEGLLVPMIGSLVDGIANNSFDALAGKNGQYEAAREAFYKMPLPVQLAANFVDPLQVAAGSVVGVAKLAKPLRALDDAMKVAKDAGDAAAIGRLKTLAGQVDAALKPSGLLGSSNTRMAELTVKRALPYVNHETRTVQQIAEAAANQGKYGLGPGAVKVGKNLENQYERVGVEAPTALQRIGSMLDMTKPTNSAYRSRMMDTVGELSTLISSKVKGVPEDYVNTLVDILNSPVTGKKITGYEEFTDSTRAKEMIAYMRTMASPETLKPAERIRWQGEVKPEFLDSVLTNAAKKVLGEDLSVIPTEAQKAQIGTETVGAMLRKLDETLKLYYPDQPMNPVQKVLAAFKNASATYLYMGYSPGYVARNIVSNYIPAMIDGTFSMEGAGQATKDAIRFGLTSEMMRGLGAADVGSWAMETAGRGYVQALREGGPKGLLKGPALQLGQVAEQKASVRIAVNAMKSAYNKFWSGVARPQMPEDVAQALGKNVGIVNSKIGLAVNHKELEQVLTDLSGIAGMTRVRQMGDPAILEEARKISPEFAKEVETIFRESGDKTLRQVSETIAKSHNEKYAMRVAAEHLAEDNDVAALADKVAEAVGKGASEKEAISEATIHARDARALHIDQVFDNLSVAAEKSLDPVLIAATKQVDSDIKWVETVGWWRRNKYQNLATHWEDPERVAWYIEKYAPQDFAEGITTSEAYLAKHYISDPILKTLKETHVGRNDPRYQFIVKTFRDEDEQLQPKIANLKAVVEKKGPKPQKVTPDMAAKLKALGHSDIDIEGMTVDQANGLIATSTKKAAEAKPVAKAPVVSAGQVVKDVTNKTWAFMPDTQERVAMNYRVIDLDDAIASHDIAMNPNPAYPKEFQARMRERAASDMQTTNMARNLDPDQLLAEMHSLDRGAPIVGPDRIVESGNGRVIALRKAVQNFPDKYTEYRTRLSSVLPEYGLSDTDMAGMRHPILVRERPTVEGRATVAQQGNAVQVAAMSAIEKARTEASLLTDENVLSLKMADGESLDKALLDPKNADITRGFVGRMSPNEAAALVDRDGALNSDGARRIADALLMKAYRGDAAEKLATIIRDSADPDVQGNIMGAIRRTVLDMARLESRIATGQAEASLSITDDLARATDVLARLRQEKMAVKQYLAQGALFDRELTPFQETMLAFLDKSGKSTKKVQGMIEGYVREVEDASGLFGTGGTKEELYDRAVRRVEGLPDIEPVTKQQPDLFSAPVEAAPTPKAATKLEEGNTVRPTTKSQPQAAEVVAPAPVAQPSAGAAATTPEKLATQPPVQAPVQRSHVQADGAKAMNDAMAKVLADTNDWITKHWDEMGTATDTVTMAKTRAWIEDVVKPAQTQAVLASRQYGVAMRDAALHNYADRRNFDIFASYLYPFSYWYTRSGMAYMDRMVRNPALITSYVDLMQKITDMNKTLPLSWQNQIQLPGFDDNPMYVNLRTLIDPLYQSMSNAMNAAYKSGGGTVENALAQLGGWGPSLQAPLIYAMAGMGQFSDNNDWIGYQSGGLIGERPVKAMSALARSAGLGLNVIPPGGWNIEGPIRQIVSPALQTTGAMIRPAVNAVGTALLGDKFKPNTDTAALQRQDPAELTRAAKYLATEFQKGTINPETGVPITKDDMNKAMQLQSGALWDMARQLEGQASALPNLTSTLIGASVRTHDIDEQQLQNSRDEYYTKIKPLKTTDPAAYTAALNDFKARYPWYFSLSGVKYNDTPEAKQKAYETGRGYTVLMERVPPGYQAGMSAEQKALISKFFDLKGAFEQFSPTEQKAFSVLMDSLEKKYPTAPTDTEKAERAQAKAENTAYWNLPAGKERTAFKKSHPTWSKFYAGQPFVVTPKK